MKTTVKQHTRRYGRKKQSVTPCRVDPQKPFFTDMSKSTGNTGKGNIRQFCGLCGRRVNYWGFCPVHGDEQIESYNPFAGIMLLAGIAGAVVCAILAIVI